MSNEIAVIKQEQFPALVDGSDLREALLANTRGVGFQESDLVRVTTPAAGATNWTVNTVSGEENTPEIRGILVYFAPRGVLWPTLEPDALGSQPLLVTNDLVSAQRFGDVYGDIDPDVLEQYAVGDNLYDWTELPWNQWGSGKNGIGKRCKESRLLMILRENEAFPLVIRAQPGSLKTVRPFIMRLPVPHYRAVVCLKLQKVQNRGGQPFSQIVPTLVGTIDKATGEKVQALYTTPIQRMAESGGLDIDREGGYEKDNSDSF